MSGVGIYLLLDLYRIVCGTPRTAQRIDILVSYRATKVLDDCLKKRLIIAPIDKCSFTLVFDQRANNRIRTLTAKTIYSKFSL